MNRRTVLSALFSSSLVLTNGCTLGNVQQSTTPRPTRDPQPLEGHWNGADASAKRDRRSRAAGAGRDASTWSATVDGSGYAEPLVSGGLAFESVDGSVATIEVVSGQRLATGVDGESGVPVAARDGAVIVATNDGTQLREHDIETGQQRWSVGLGNPIVGVTATETRVYVPDQFANVLKAIDRERGSVVWEYELVRAPGPVACTEGEVVVPMDNYAFRVSEAERAWSRQFEGRVHDLSLAAGGSAVVATDAGELCRITASNDETWSVTHENAPDSIALASDRVFASLPGGTVVAHSLETGDELLRRSIGRSSARLTVGPEAVYGSSGGEVFALDQTTGGDDPLWRRTLGDLRPKGPVVVEGTVLARTGRMSSTGEPATLHAVREE